MNTELWNKIFTFNLDNHNGDYDFSTRLTNENYWTQDFTEKAIIEYKKFMYLATISDHMVSPSEIVDSVWHQHLLFTRSYQYFCQLLNKNIHHIPSTHNPEEHQKFLDAKQHTKELYESHFGQQPSEIWN